MKHALTQTYTSLTLIVTVLFSGCQTVTPAPGSDKVHVTRDPKDVAACKPVGNIAVQKADSGYIDMANADTQFRNRAIGLGGNTALVTSGLEGTPVEGIAYHCD